MERDFQTLADSAPVILWIAGADGSLEWFNKRWYEYTGLTSEEASGWRWQVVHHREDFPEVMRRWPASVATGEPFEMEFRIRAADGSYRWFITKAQPVRDEQGVIQRWYGSNIDIDAQRREYDGSVRAAKALQQIFLPPTLPHDSTVRFDAVYRPSEREALVGGDWYDAFQLGDGRIAFSIGDVGGHGVGAAVLAGTIRQAISALSVGLDDPADVVREINRIVFYRSPGTLVTAIVGFIDNQRKALRYSNAGHPYPIIARQREQAEPEVPLGTVPLGVYADIKNVRTAIVNITDDMLIVLYTDGVTEVGRDIIAGERLLRELVPRFVGDVTTEKPAEVMLREALNGRAPFDDTALMAIQFSDIPAETLANPSAPLRKVWRFHSSDAYSAHTSRIELTAYLSALAADSNECFVGELILGEILANTVQHAPGMVEINIDWTQEKPVVSIRDSGRGFLSLDSAALPTDLLDDNGRGLFLIKTLADSAAVRTSSGGGTDLCVTLPVRRNEAAPD